MIVGERRERAELNRSRRSKGSGSRMAKIVDESASILEAVKWLSQPYVSLEHPRKHRLEPTR